MEHFDHDYVARVIERLSRLKADAKPEWGRMTPKEMVAHLAATVRYSMGRSGDVKVQSTWFRRNVIGPLIMHGLVKIPRNVPNPGYAASEQVEAEAAAAALLGQRGRLFRAEADEEIQASRRGAQAGEAVDPGAHAGDEVIVAVAPGRQRRDGRLHEA